MAFDAERKGTRQRVLVREEGGRQLRVPGLFASSLSLEVPLLPEVCSKDRGQERA